MKTGSNFDEFCSQDNLLLAEPLTWGEWGTDEGNDWVEPTDNADLLDNADLPGIFFQSSL